MAAIGIGINMAIDYIMHPKATININLVSCLGWVWFFINVLHKHFNQLLIQFTDWNPAAPKSVGHLAGVAVVAYSPSIESCHDPFSSILSLHWNAFFFFKASLDISSLVS